MRAIVAATAVDEELARQVAFARLSGEIPRGRSVQPESVTFERGMLKSLDASGRATFTMTAAASALAELDQAALQNRLIGLSIPDALAWLTTQLDLQPGSTPEITVSPDWFGRLPLLAPRITIDDGSGAP